MTFAGVDWRETRIKPRKADPFKATRLTHFRFLGMAGPWMGRTHAEPGPEEWIENCPGSPNRQHDQGPRCFTAMADPINVAYGQLLAVIAK